MYKEKLVGEEGGFTGYLFLLDLLESSFFCFLSFFALFFFFYGGGVTERIYSLC